MTPPPSRTVARPPEGPSRLVVGLGGNALLRRDEAMTSANQARNVGRAAQALAPVARHRDTVVVHGNGPQVGLLALQDASTPGSGGFPLDVLAAETSGMIGYPVAQALRNALPGRQVVGLLTQVEVDPDDPAFADPTKPIGQVYDAETARGLRNRFGWTLRPEGDGERRVVPSPAPVRILEMDAIRLLVDSGVLVLCAGGGGIPVVVDAAGRAHGVEAIIDKDLSAALVARELAADGLLFLTDVDAVVADWGTPDARPLRSLTPDQADGLDLAAGSMGPKVRAAASFSRATGHSAWIGRLDQAEEVVAGRAGTRIGPPERAADADGA